MIANIINGKIETFTNIPNKWNNTLGYNYLDSSIHNEDGFKSIVEPQYNSTTSYKGGLIYDEVNNVFTYEVIDFSVEQLAVNLTIKEESEDKSDFEMLERKGFNLYEKTKERLIRRNKKGLLTKLRAKKVREILHPVFLYLKNGDIDLANDYAIDPLKIPTNSNADIEAELAWFKGQLTELLLDVNNLL